MYEVFLNDRKIVITQRWNKSFVKEAVITENLISTEKVKNWFLEFVATENKLAVLYHPSPSEFWENLFLPAFTQIPAAGGVVIRNDKLLFIKRNDRWDLPKGKIDFGETPEVAALREVEEECGIVRHQIKNKLPSTFHIFQSPYEETLGQWIIKETHWYEMIYKGKENGLPQTIENITEIRWFGKNKLGKVISNTYDNLKSIISIYKT